MGYLQHALLISQTGSGFSRKCCTSAHIEGQVLTSEGQTCSLGTAFTISPEEKARIHAKLSATLADLRAGRLPPGNLPYIIHEFGEEHFEEALPEIVASLTSKDERVSYMALHVLTFHFQLKDYKYAAIEMLLHDPDAECRQQAAAG